MARHCKHCPRPLEFFKRSCLLLKFQQINIKYQLYDIIYWEFLHIKVNSATTSPAPGSTSASSSSAPAAPLSTSPKMMPQHPVPPQHLQQQQQQQQNQQRQQQMQNQQQQMMMQQQQQMRVCGLGRFMTYLLGFIASCMTSVLNA